MRLVLTVPGPAGLENCQLVSPSRGVHVLIFPLSSLLLLSFYHAEKCNKVTYLKDVVHTNFIFHTNSPLEMLHYSFVNWIRELRRQKQEDLS